MARKTAVIPMTLTVLQGHSHTTALSNVIFHTSMQHLRRFQLT